MKLVIYSTADLSAITGAIDEFTEESAIPLTLHTHRDHKALMADLTTFPADFLFYDVSEADDPAQRLQEVRLTLPYTDLILMSRDPLHAQLGYAVASVGFLDSNCSPEELLSVLVELIRRKKEILGHYLSIKVNGVWCRIRMDHLMYVESAGHTLIFHMDDGQEFRMTAAFRDYLRYLLVNRNFCCCHKSYVVNLSHADRLEQNAFILKNGESVNISRPYRQRVRTYYACYTTDIYDSDTLEEITQKEILPGIREHHEGGEA